MLQGEVYSYCGHGNGRNYFEKFYLCNTIISTVCQCNNGTRYYAGLQNKSTLNIKIFLKERILDARVSVPVTFNTSSTLKKEVIICKLSLAFLHKINRHNTNLISDYT